MHLGGRYKLLSAPLSTGSFGSVFMADDERMPRRVAVKILHPQHAENPTVRARFRRELEAACRVSHENVVSVFDIGEDPKLGLYYVMELVKGTPLKDYLNGEPLPWLFVHRVATQITRALHAIHAAGIVHRDLKPQNIMLVERSSLEELVKVLDFGIASLKTPDEDRRDVELTGARMVLGTPPYMSPEQTYMRSDRERLNLDVDARSDVYSLGVILYEMAAGRRPFAGDAHDIVVAHRLTRPMPLDKMVGVAVPREFADLVMRCLSKDPSSRPQSAKELLTALRDCELKPVRRWSEVTPTPVHDPHDLPTQGEHIAISVDAVPADTQPRLEIPPRASGSKTKSLWGPLAALSVGGVLAIAAFATSRPDDLALAPSAASATPIETERPERVGPVLAAAPTKPALADAGPTVANAPSQTDPPAAPDTLDTNDAPADAAANMAGASASPTDATTVPADVAAVGFAPPPSATAPGPSDTAEVVEKKVGVMLTTQPPGAIVLVAGVEKGTTPVTLSFDVAASSELAIVLRKDRFEDRAVVLPIGPDLAGQTLVVHHDLERKRGARPPGHDPFKDL